LLRALQRSLLLLLALSLGAARAAAQPDPGEPGSPHIPFVLPFAASDVVFDAPRGMLYASSLANQRVYFVDLATGLVTREFSFDWLPESLALTPDGSRLFVALLVQPRGDTWSADPQAGYVAGFDLDAQVMDRELSLGIDPFDLVATSDGHLVVSPGYGQAVGLRTFDAVSGALRGTAQAFRHRMHLALHPGEAIVYGATTDISPTDIYRFDLGAGGAIQYRWDSRYHGGHRMDGNVWASPLGDSLVTRGGDVFTAGAATGELLYSDMLYRRGLTPGRIEGLAFDAPRNVILTAGANGLGYYNLHTFESIGATSLAGGASHVGVVDAAVYAVQVGAAATSLIVLDHPLPNGASDTAPDLDYSLLPGGALTTQTDVTIDASGSSDAEGELLYRWDIDGDGVWDGDFSPDPVLVHRFALPGTKRIRVQIKDAAGWTDEVSFSVDVAFAPDPANPGAPHPGSLLQTTFTDAVFDPLRPYLYVSSRTHRTVSVVDVETGFVVKTFSLPWLPEHLALTPDGARLFVEGVEHDDYWLQGRRYFIAGFDLEQQVQDREFEIPDAAFDLVATTNGQLVASPETAFWGRVFDAASGEVLHSRLLDGRSHLALHGSESIVYASSGQTVGLDRFDLSAGGTLALVAESPYPNPHTYHIGGDLWLSPLGDALVSGGRGVFSAGRAPQEDFVPVADLASEGIGAALFDPARRTLFTGSGGTLAYHNLASFENVGASAALSGEIAALGLRGLRVNVLLREGGMARLTGLAHPLPNAGNDAPPVAALAAVPAAGATTRTDISFDASGSTDAEGALVYRFDAGNDGVWDTGYSSDPRLVRRYATAGSRDVRVRVKDGGGNVDDHVVTVDVVFEPGAVRSAADFVLPFAASHAVFDPVRPYLYVSSKERRTISIVSLATGLIMKTLPFDAMPERMVLTPDGAQLYVALLAQPHSSYWWAEDQEGFIGRIDLEQQVQDLQFPIDLDPFDLAVTLDGGLVVTSGSGQWTRLRVYDRETGAPRGSFAYPVRQRSVVELHPSGERFYTGGGTSAPQDLHRWHFDPAGGPAYAWDSIYHGGHLFGDDFWASPLGDVLVTAGGDVFSAGGTSRDTDLLYQEGTGGVLRDLVWSVARGEWAGITEERVRVHDLVTHDELERFELDGTGRFVGFQDARVYALQVDGNQSEVDVFVRGNRAPPASIAALAPVECSAPFGAEVLLEADGPGDPDSVPGLFDDIVSYAWLRDGAPLGGGRSLRAPFALGSHEVELRVTDHGGATTSAFAQVQVVDTQPPVLAIAAQPPALAATRKLVDVALGVTSYDMCGGGVTVTLTGATSNAPKKPLKDIKNAKLGTDDRAVRLRAEQNRTAPPRLYTLTYTARDERGHEGSVDVEIPVVGSGP